MNTDDLNFVLKARREKLDQLLARGVLPFAYRFERSHAAADAAQLGARVAEGAEGERVRVAGRLIAWRGHGKTAFAHIADQSGRIQLYFRRDALGDERWATVEALDIREAEVQCGEHTRRVHTFVASVTEAQAAA